MTTSARNYITASLKSSGRRGIAVGVEPWIWTMEDDIYSCYWAPGNHQSDIKHHRPVQEAKIEVRRRQNAE